MRRIVIIAASMEGVSAATRIKRRMFEHEINLIIPDAVTEPQALSGPAGERHAAAMPNLETAATREIGILEAKDIMPDLDEKELVLSSARGSVTIRYSDLVLEVPATARLPRPLQRCGNVFGWPMQGFAAGPASLDAALAKAVASGLPVLVVGAGAASLDAVCLALESGATVHWLRTGEKESPALDPHLASFVAARLKTRLRASELADVQPERLGFSLSEDGTELEGLSVPGGAESGPVFLEGACCLWTAPLMAVHPILRESGIHLDPAGRIVSSQTDRPDLYLMGTGAAVPGAVLPASRAVMPSWPGSADNAALSGWLAVDGVTGTQATSGQGVYGIWRAGMPGLRFCRAGLTAAEASRQDIEAEHAIFSAAVSETEGDKEETAQGSLTLCLICDRKSRTVIGAQVLGLNIPEELAEGLFGMALAALADGTDVGRLSRRAPAGLPGGILAQAAAIIRNKLDTVIQGISPDEFLASRDAGAEFFTLDLRSMPDWRAGHVPGAYSIPLPQLKKRLQDEVPRFTPIVLVSSDGRDAYAVASRLAGLGATALYVLDGGMALWPYALETE